MVHASDPWSHVYGVVARSGTSFLWSMKVISPERRRAMYAIYAFCREVDDIADNPGGIAVRKQALQEWRHEVARLYAGSPRLPTARALNDVIRRFDLPQEEFLSIIEGMETDVADSVRMTRLEDLLAYCRKVAGAVGMLVIHTFGVPGHPGPQMAQAMGNAFQLTNILRDLEEDARLKRLYVPGEILARHGVEVGSPHDALHHPGFPAACAELASLARRYYAQSERLLGELGYRRVRPLVAMMKVYCEILDLLERRGWENVHIPVRLTLARKMWLALRYGTL